MLALLLNFHTWRLQPFEVTRISQAPPGAREPMPEVVEPDWHYWDYLPPGPVAQTRFQRGLADGLSRFAAIMRVWVTLEADEWPGGFQLLYQSEAGSSFEGYPQFNWRRRNAWGHLVPTAIDPPGCGCTECLVGEYVPWERAGPGLIRDLVAGYISNHTYQMHWVEFKPTSDGWQQQLVSHFA